MFSIRVKTLKQLKRLCFRFSSSIQQKTGTTAPAPSYRLQFSKATLTEFGDLPRGEVPEALKYDRLVEQSALENGVNVVTEKWNSPLSSVSVLLKVGSRMETLENSGVSQFLERLNLRGTTSRTRDQVEQELDELGGQLSVKTNRESQVYTLTFEPNQADRAIAFLGDLLTNSLYTDAQIEAEKDSLFRSAVDQKDQCEVIMESGHYTSYRDHYMGQPKKGVRENIVNITAEQVKEFHGKHFVGPNVVVTGAGSLNHNQFVSAVAKAFGGLSSLTPNAVANSEKPYFTPSIMSMRDDELTNLNVGVFFEVPGLKHPDSLALHMFTRILGDYRADKYTGAHLNSSDRQYNQMHAMLGNLPDVTIHRSKYMPYSDTGLMGNYFMGNEVYASQMAFGSQMVLSEYASYINPVEVFRARARIFNELLSEESTGAVSQEMASQVVAWGRRMPRSEFARRISAIDAGYLNRVATRHFWDKDITVVMWGPTHLLQSISHYGRPWKRSTLGSWAYQYYSG